MRKNYSKALYRYINSKKQHRAPIARLKTSTGGTAQNDIETAEELNNFFQSVFVKEKYSDIIAFNDFARQCFDMEVAEPFDYIGVVARNVLDSIEIDRNKVIKALKALDPNKTPGPDGLH